MMITPLLSLNKSSEFKVSMAVKVIKQRVLYFGNIDPITNCRVTTIATYGELFHQGNKVNIEARMSTQALLYLIPQM